MVTRFPVSPLNPQPIHSLIYPLTFLALSKQHFHNILFFSRVHLWLCMDNSITPDSEVLPKTSGLGDSDTIALPVGSSGIPSFISVFVLFIFIKDRWVFLNVPTLLSVFIVTPSLEGLPYLAQRGPSTLIEGWLSRAKFPTYECLCNITSAQ